MIERLQNIFLKGHGEKGGFAPLVDPPSPAKAA